MFFPIRLALVVIVLHSSFQAYSMDIYINGIGNISSDSSVHDASNKLLAIEPNYSDFIDAKIIRRMSKMVKMGVTASLMALKTAKQNKPEAIIVGTGFGCLDDTNSFLNQMIENKEEALSPTPFIFSTHNSLAGQIALLHKCQGYNATYVHRNISFESALMDAQLLLQEQSYNTVLVGGADETTNTSFKILSRLGHFCSHPVESNSTTNSSKPYAGEGSSFFVLSNQKNETSFAKILSIKTLSFKTNDQIYTALKSIFTANQVSSVDLVLSSHNGDPNDDRISQLLLSSFDLESKYFAFKSVCGEYNTASAFALYLASNILNKTSIPGLQYSKITDNKSIKSILIHNHYRNTHHSFILLSAC